MRAPGWLVIASCLIATVAAADPKPTEIDSKPFKDRLMLFQDAQGGTYAVLRDASPRVFYGTGKQLYEQIVTGSGANEDQWSIGTWAPRVHEIRPGQILRMEDGSFKRDCDGLDDAGLTAVVGEKATKLLASVKLMSPATTRIPYLLARDDAGVYYYVDKLRKGDGYRVFVGKKGAMKQMPLSDVAIDMAGAVFSTKTGDLRLVRSTDSGEKESVKWVHGEKGTDLHFLDVDAASVLIFKDLGIYGFLGTLCDNA